MTVAFKIIEILAHRFCRRGELGRRYMIVFKSWLLAAALTRDTAEGSLLFTALKQAFGDRYIYAGVGTTLAFGPGVNGGKRKGEGPAVDENDLSSYRRFAVREDPFGILAMRAREEAARPTRSG
jgi:hypothetical protein